MNIPLVNATVVVTKENRKYQVGAEYIGIWFDDQLHRYGAVSAETGELVFLDIANASLRFYKDGEKPIVNNVEVEDAASAGTITWLKGQIKNLAKRVKELEDGTANK